MKRGKRKKRKSYAVPVQKVKRKFPWRFVGLGFMVVLAAVIVIFALLGFRFMPYDDITAIFYGDHLVAENNIPFKIDMIKLGNTALVRPRFYNIGRLNPLVGDMPSREEFFSEVFYILSNVEYVDGQQDPSKIFELGGDCQSLSIYLVNELQRVGIPSGFIPDGDHVYCWAILHDRFYKIDLTTREVSVLSLIDRDRVLVYLPELSHW